jgi:cell division protein ZipA
MGCGSSGQDDERVRVPVGGGEFYVAPAGASRARVQGILPSTGSEDVSSLLGPLDSHVKRSKDEGERDYLPDTATDSVIDVLFDGDPRLDPNRVSGLFGADWRRLYGGLTIFALDPDKGHWTFLISANGPKQVTRLKMAWDFIDPTDDADLPSAQVFSARVVAVETAVRSLGVAVLETSLSPEEAAHRARWLREFKTNLDYSPTVILRAPKGKRFEGRNIWDVMLCLGLNWGDMDVFHWDNPSGLGDDSFFSVWTSTPPGYFLPEEMSVGNVRVDDLVFGFSAPRCSEPSQVFESIVRAVEYARKRLGGTIADKMGGEADLEEIRRKIRTVEHEMRANGFTPGGDSALRLF